MNESEHWLHFAREDLRVISLFQELPTYLGPSDLNEIKEIMSEIQGRIARYRNMNEIISVE